MPMPIPIRVNPSIIRTNALRLLWILGLVISSKGFALAVLTCVSTFSGSTLITHI